MSKEKLRSRLLKIFIIAGLLIATLSALEPHISWLSELCGILGDGCKDTVQFSLFNIPVSVWGIIFYVFLFLCALVAGTRLFWPVMCGVGVELALVKIMITQNSMCVFCLLNLIVIFVLFLLVIKRSHIWQMVAVCLLFFVVCDNVLYKEDLPPETVNITERSSSVLAVIGDVELDEKKLMSSVIGRLYKLERQIYQLKRRQLDTRIKAVLFQKEAIERGITPAELNRQIFSKMEAVTDEDVENYYNKNIDYYKKQKDPVVKIKRNIRLYLQEKKRTGIMDDFVEPLKTKFAVVEYLDEPIAPMTNVNISGNISTGPDDAAVTIVEFSDYMCPSCRRAHKTTKEIRDEFKGRIKWVFKDYPLKRHKGAKKLAAAARCAAEQGKFWEYQDLLFESDGDSDNATLIKYAEKLGLNVEQFTRSLNSNKYQYAVEKDIRDARNSGVSSTPTFFINGKLSIGMQSLEKFKKKVNDILNKK